jgi:MFS family permease
VIPVLKAAPTRVRYAVLAMVFSAAFFTYLDRVFISVAAPLMQADLHLTLIQFAWVFTVFQLAYGLLVLPSAWLGDQWGQRRMMMFIVSCWSLFTALTGAVRGLVSLLMTQAIFGAAESGAFPTLSRSLSRWFPLEQRTRANGVLWMGARSGAAFAPPIAVMLIAAVGWRWALPIFGAGGLVWVLIWALWYRDDPANHPAVNGAELAIIRSGAAPAPNETQQVPWARMLADPNMLLLFTTYFCSGFGFSFFVTWMPTYFTREFGISLTKSGFYSALPLAAGVAGCALGGILADAITRRTGNLVLGRRAIGCGGFLLGAAGYGAAIWMRSPVAAAVSLAVAFGAHDLTLPVLWATSTDVGGKFGGSSAGWINLASCIAGMAAPLAMAALEQTFGSFNSVFYVASVLYVLAGIAWLFIDPRKRIDS